MGIDLLRCNWCRWKLCEELDGVLSCHKDEVKVCTSEHGVMPDTRVVSGTLNTLDRGYRWVDCRVDSRRVLFNVLDSRVYESAI